jgi:hypothetical protein
MAKKELIEAYRNKVYGPPTVTQKYAPLDRISLDTDDRDFCDSLLISRWNVLNSLGLLPQPLYLSLPSWPVAIAAEAGKKPPLVVISSNRSKWIKDGIEAGKLQLQSLTSLPEQFDNVSDLRALTAKASQTVSPPVYYPKRIGAAASPRNVYVLVHAAECEVYARNLAGTGITVVGWAFRRPRRDATPICGFGASRFAAIEFCKQLRTAAGDPWDYAWLLDDNVVAFTSFAGYGKVEEAMDRGKRAGTPYICAGFSGGAKAESQLTNKTYAETARGTPADLPPSKTPGLIQQGALWNIAELTNRNLNFGPIFVASGEDVSLGNYFDMKKIPYLYYGGVGIRKEDTKYDNEPGSRVVQKGKEEITELFAGFESLDTFLDVRQPPPPVMFRPLKDGEDKAKHDMTKQALGRFIVETVMPNASTAIQLKANDPNEQNIAICQATEQSICRAMKLGIVNDPALDQTFKINGDRPQEVVRITRGTTGTF